MYDSPLDTIRGLLDPADATPVSQLVLLGISESTVRAALRQLQSEGEAVETGDGWLRVFKVEAVKEVKPRELQRSFL